MRTRGVRSALVAVVACFLLVSAAPNAVPSAARWRTCGRFVEVEQITIPGAMWTRLQDVAHLSTHDAWAIGHVESDRGSGPIALRWDGWRWDRAPLPFGPAAERVGLQRITALAPDDVWAVGWIGRRPLAVHFDGERWSRTTQPEGVRGQLSAITSIPSTHAMLAVGGRAVPGQDQPLVERWNGEAWRVVRTPTLPFGGSLESVVSFGKVAYAAGTRGTSHPLAMRWSGHAWKTVPVPHGRRNGSLGGVDGTSPARVWFVGGIERRDGEDRRHGLILRWQEGHLRVSKTLDRASGLSDVTVAGPRSVWVVGGILTGGIEVDPIVLARTAGGWTRDPAPRVDGRSNGLLNVDGTPHDLWAVSQDAGEGPSSYLLHRC